MLGRALFNTGLSTSEHMFHWAMEILGKTETVITIYQGISVDSMKKTVQHKI
jgi:hypothetical protein